MIKFTVGAGSIQFAALDTFAIFTAIGLTFRDSGAIDEEQVEALRSRVVSFLEGKDHSNRIVNLIAMFEIVLRWAESQTEALFWGPA